MLMLAGTFRTIRKNLVHQRAVATWSVGIRLVGFCEILVWVGVVIFLLSVFRHPTTILLIVMALVALEVSRRMHIGEEIRSLNQWLGIAVQNGSSVGEMVEAVASGCQTSVAIRARRFAHYLDIGVPAEKAARRAKLSLDTNIVLALMTDRGEANLKASKNAGPRRPMEAPAAEDSSVTMTLIAQQFGYMLALILMACVGGFLLGMESRSHWGEMKGGIVTDLDFDDLWFSTIPTVERVGVWVAAIVLFWTLMFFVIRWLPVKLVRWVPWFGNHAITGWRCDVLETISRSVASHQSVGETLSSLGSATRISWIRKQSLRAENLLSSGVTLPDSLRRSKIVSKKESAWLAAALANNHLAFAIERLVDDVRRRQVMKWRVRVAWLMPLVTVAVGAYVLAYAYATFELLTLFIEALPQ